MDNDDLVLKS